MNCPNCNNSINVGTEICDICGFNLKQDQKKIPSKAKSEKKVFVPPTSSKSDETKTPAEISSTETKSIKATNKNNISSEQEESGEKSESFGEKKSQLFLPLILFSVTIFLVLFFTLILPYIQDLNTKKMYVIATNLFIRSTPFTGSQANILGKAPFGTLVKVFEEKNGWAEVEVLDIEGYMSLNYLISEKQFIELNSIYGNNYARELVRLTNCKRALLNYYNSKNIIGNIHPDLQREIYGKVLATEKWQVFGLNGDSEYNSVSRGYFSSSVNRDFACIINNLSSGERRLLIFRIIDDNNSQLLFDKELDGYEYIKTVKKGRKSGRFYHGRIKKYLESDAILCKPINSSGSDKLKLIVFNGNEFEIHQQ